MSKQKGQGLLEFALILPLLLLMFFGIIEFGRIFQAYLTVQHAAREAARYAVTGQGGAERVRAIKEKAVEATAGLRVDYSKIDRRECTPGSGYYAACVQDSPPGSGCDDGMGTVWEYHDEPNALLVQVHSQATGGLCENNAGGPGERVLVRVVYNLESLTPFFSGLFPFIRLTGQMEMINEGFGATGAAHGGVLPPTLEPLPEMGPTDSTTLFTDAGGLERNEYGLGDPIYVTVTDNDENLNLQSVDTITVIVRDGSTDSEMLTLTETGPNTGEFRAGLPSSGSAGISGDGTLNTAEGNTITAEYTDDDDSSDTSSDTATMLAGLPGTDSQMRFTGCCSWDEKGEYVIGAGDIYVTVRDADENLDSGTAETVYVSVTDSETGDSVTLLPLTETGPDTGFFRNLTGLQSSIDLVNTSDNILQTEGGNTIIAEYTDDDDDTDYSYAIALVTAPVCQVDIAEPVYATDPWIRVYGSPGDTIRIWDMDAGGATIGSGTIQGSDCNASVDIIANLQHCHVLYAISTLHPLFDSTRVGVGPCGLTANFTAAPTSGDEPLTVVFTDTSESQDGISTWEWDLDGDGSIDSNAQNPTFEYTASGVYTVTLTVREADGDWDSETKVSYITVNPSTAYIVLDPTCISADQAASITVTGRNWQGNKDIEISWDATSKATVPSGDIVDGSWTRGISIAASEATTGTHTVKASDNQPSPEENSKTVEIPCPPPPDLRPDLVITDFTVSPGVTVGAYQPVSFTVVIENQGQTDALSVFWVDLFIDPAPAPPEAGQSNGDVAWEAASVLGAGETTMVTIDYTFSVTGTHLAYGYVDTRMHIDEKNEDNNASSPLPLTVEEGTLPPATLASDPVCSGVGVSKTITVSGWSWPTDEGPINLYWDGTSKGSVSPQVIWSQPITISTSEAISQTHIISASTGSTVITRTYDIPCEVLGRIDGYTWIFMGGDIVPQGRVDVFCYDDSDNLIAQTTSDENGYYDLGYLSSGTYTVKGQAYIDEILYIDIRAGVTVSGGSITRVTLLLMPEY